ncbi:hypothetical protein EV182_001890 [Spiromyces aspiralis]|uniref:Uncharacterized protein n=1 Tax=Spiromyces aspiralis TaxID=68401 RepID=A0ACC1HU00_9FUNG|nr:hypothetical protein EV182_001890 [Spiromyces aspiralis]
MFSTSLLYCLYASQFYDTNAEVYKDEVMAAREHKVIYILKLATPLFISVFMILAGVLTTKDWAYYKTKDKSLFSIGAKMLFKKGSRLDTVITVIPKYAIEPIAHAIYGIASVAVLLNLIKFLYERKVPKL